MNHQRVLPPTCLCIAILLIVTVHLLFPGVTFKLIPWGILGLVPLGLGIILNLVADSVFKDKSTTVKPFQESKVLITTGVFSISRNPMYLGFILILTGIGLLLGSVTPFFIVLFFWFFLKQYYIVAEERMLEKQFQADWHIYRKKVRRWI